MKIFTGTTVQVEQTVTIIISGSENQLSRWFKSSVFEIDFSFSTYFDNKSCPYYSQ